MPMAVSALAARGTARERYALSRARSGRCGPDRRHAARRYAGASNSYQSPFRRHIERRVPEQALRKSSRDPSSGAARCVRQRRRTACYLRAGQACRLTHAWSFRAEQSHRGTYLAVVLGDPWIRAAVFMGIAVLQLPPHRRSYRQGLRLEQNAALRAGDGGPRAGGTGCLSCWRGD